MEPDSFGLNPEKNGVSRNAGAKWLRILHPYGRDMLESERDRVNTLLEETPQEPHQRAKELALREKQGKP